LAITAAFFEVLSGIAISHRLGNNDNVMDILHQQFCMQSLVGIGGCTATGNELEI